MRSDPQVNKLEPVTFRLASMAADGRCLSCTKPTQCTKHAERRSAVCDTQRAARDQRSAATKRSTCESKMRVRTLRKGAVSLKAWSKKGRY